MVKRYLLHDLLFGLSVVVSILAFFNNMGTVAGSSSVTLTPWLEQLHINFEVEREEGVISRRHLLDCSNVSDIFPSATILFVTDT